MLAIGYFSTPACFPGAYLATNKVTEPCPPGYWCPAAFTCIIPCSRGGWCPASTRFDVVSAEALRDTCPYDSHGDEDPSLPAKRQACLQLGQCCTNYCTVPAKMTATLPNGTVTSTYHCPGAMIPVHTKRTSPDGHPVVGTFLTKVVSINCVLPWFNHMNILDVVSFDPSRT